MLGEINDATMAMVLANGLSSDGHVELAAAVGALGQQSTARRKKAFRHLSRAWDTFQDAAPFWR